MSEFVACMEDVLDLYAEPYDPKRPVVCFDETAKMRLPSSWCRSNGLPSRPRRDGGSGLITSASATGPGTYS